MNIRLSSGVLALEVRRDLRARVAGLRTRREVDDAAVPRWVEEDTYRFRGRLVRRLRVILRSNGCSHPTCTMCPFPNEGASQATSVPDGAMVEQVRRALAASGPAELVSVYNDGSFFADVELSPDARREICHLVSESGAETLMVESLPHLVTEERLDGVMCPLRTTQLAVGIGLQAVDRVVRELCVNSPVRLDAFVRAHALLRSRSQITKAYLMLKPPFLTESEGIEQAVSSVAWLSHLGVEDIAICPTRVVEGTLAAELYEAGIFLPPRLSSVVEVLRRLQRAGNEARVSMFNIASSDLRSVAPAGCPACHHRMVAVIDSYNTDITVDLTDARCASCEAEAGDEAVDVPIEQRVANYFARRLTIPPLV